MKILQKTIATTHTPTHHLNDHNLEVYSLNLHLANFGGPGINCFRNMANVAQVSQKMVFGHLKKSVSTVNDLINTQRDYYSQNDQCVPPSFFE